VTDDKTIFALDVEAKPNTLSDLLAPGVYRLEILIGAPNAAPKSKILEISLTGYWYPDEQKMFSDGIGIVEVN